MADKIFINYRREDSIGTAGRLRDRLAEAFGEENLFMGRQRRRQSARRMRPSDSGVLFPVRRKISNDMKPRYSRDTLRFW